MADYELKPLETTSNPDIIWRFEPMVHNIRNARNSPLQKFEALFKLEEDFLLMPFKLTTPFEFYIFVIHVHIFK